MSFNFRWPTFSEQFHQDAKSMLNAALNKGAKPKVIADDIHVEELGMGTIVRHFFTHTHFDDHC
jgi:mitochondrial distribution and morphology protein 34